LLALGSRLAQDVLFWDWLLVQSSGSILVSPLLVVRSHLAVGPFLGLVVFRRIESVGHVKQPAHPLFEFGLPLEYCPTEPSRGREPNSSSHGLCIPSAHQGSEVHFSRALPARYVPPSGFGYPLDGLLPPSPCRSCFIPTALMGFTLRSFHLSQGFRTFPSGITHLPFLPPLSLMRCIRSARQAAVPGLCPFREFLASGRMFSTPTAGCSLGFCPLLGFAGKDLERDPSRSPLSRFPSPETSSWLSGVSESQSAFASLALVRHRS